MEWLKVLIEKHTKDGVLNSDELLKEVNTEFPKYAVPKSEFNTLNDTKKDLEQQIKDRDKQLKDLQGKAKGNEDLEKTITDLQEANKATKETYEAKLKDITINSAIQTKLTDTKYPDLLMTKFDKTKLSISEDGTVLGVDEQLTSIKETYKDLFIPVVTGRDPNNTGGSQLLTGKRKELETIINDPKTPFVQRVAAKNQLFNLNEEE
ncbi:phage scaffolding protein [Tissierella sp.]|uniref:phage scaffolding protein n=1 Tax=Tissierella sp. TaxID=41274 RepID=UPI002866AFEF|nr:phage scaffolding protein [Tissierella sp.]MDR7856310.1 phage scaffolding protein [Tissierella sp.]